MREPYLSIILPTYNECGNIVRLITQILQHCQKLGIPVETIVIDDNSPDQTAEIVKKRFQIPTVRVVVRTKARGLASAIKHGIKMARGELVLVMDTDFNHDPKEIAPMLKLTQKARMVIGSRYVSRGGMENRLRHYLSWMFNLYLKLLLRHGVHDNLSGFFIMRRKDILSLPLNDIFYGFGDYFIRLIYIVKRNNWPIIETPVYYKNRRWGVSKSRFADMFFTYTVTALRLRFGMIHQ